MSNVLTERPDALRPEIKTAEQATAFLHSAIDQQLQKLRASVGDREDKFSDVTVLPGVHVFEENKGYSRDPHDNHGDGITLYTTEGTRFTVERNNSTGVISVSEVSKLRNGKTGTNRSFSSLGLADPSERLFNGRTDATPEEAEAYGHAYADTVSMFADALADRIEHPEGFASEGSAIAARGVTSSVVEVASVTTNQ